MRNVLANHREVCHFWANEKQESGKANSMFFRDKTIYSYGTHFPIARHENADTILFTTQTHSISTAKHIAYTRDAIPPTKTVINVWDIQDKGSVWNSEQEKFVPSIMYDTVFSNLRTLQHDVMETLKKSVRARIRKGVYLSSAQDQLKNMRKYFSLRKNDQEDFKTFERFLSDMERDIGGDNIRVIIEEQIKKEAAEEKARQERLKIERAEKITAWQNGGSNYELSGIQTAYLRINKESGLIETSKGANCTIQEGKLLWARIKAGKPIIGQVLSGYTVISFNGELKIGCHHIERAEVERIGQLLEKKLYQIKNYGKRLDGINGITGIITGHYSEAELKEYIANSEKNNQIVSIQELPE